MKMIETIQKKIYLSFIVGMIALVGQAQIGIGINIPESSAMLQLESADKGLLMPSLTILQIEKIVTPAKGLTVYNTEDQCIQMNIGTPSAPVWECLGIRGVKRFQLNECYFWYNGGRVTSVNALGLIGTNILFITPYSAAETAIAASEITTSYSVSGSLVSGKFLLDPPNPVSSSLTGSGTITTGIQTVSGPTETGNLTVELSVRNETCTASLEIR